MTIRISKVELITKIKYKNKFKKKLLLILFIYIRICTYLHIHKSKMQILLNFVILIILNLYGVFCGELRQKLIASVYSLKSEISNAFP